jgi:arylsulfatase A-like enzyme
MKQRTRHILRISIACGLALLLSFCSGRQEKRAGPESVPARILPLYQDLIEWVPQAEKGTNRFSIDFKKGLPREILTEGWSEPAPDTSGRPFSWVVSRTATIRFPLTHASPKFLHFTCEPYRFPGAPSRRDLAIECNGRSVSRLSLKSKPREYTVPLPEAALRRGPNEVRLAFSEARSPSEFSASKDRRTLAARFWTLELDSRAEEHEFPAEPETTVSTIRQEDGKRPALRLPPDTAISFYLQVPQDSVLSFRILPEPEGRKDRAAAAKLSVIAETDGADPIPLYAAPIDRRKKSPEGEITVPLAPVARRIARITLALDGGAAPVSLLDPRVDAPPQERAHAVESTQTRDFLDHEKGANTILLILDAARPSHFSFYGYPRETTPNIAKLASHSFIFRNAFTQAPFTLSSVGTILSGLLPESHGVVGKSTGFFDSPQILARTLSDAGFETAAFVDSFAASANYGYSIGFKTFVEVFRNRFKKGADYPRHLYFSSEILPWIRKNKEKKFFMYIHARQPHTPYEPPERFRRAFCRPYEGPVDGSSWSVVQLDRGMLKPTEADLSHLKDLYDANLAYIDSIVGLLIEKLKEWKLYDRTAVWVTADHGEAFGEHGRFMHSSQLYDEMLRVPLVFKPAPGLPDSRSVGSLVALADISPTILELAGVPCPAQRLYGKSLLPFLAGSGSSEIHDFIFSRTAEDEGLFSLRSREWKYILDTHSGREELYHLTEDPGEQHDRSVSLPVLTGYFRQSLRATRLANPAPNAPSRKPDTLDEESERNKKSLGYL